MLEPQERARALIGTAFRPQGRNPAVGLDCIGLVICAYDLPAGEQPTYRLTDGSWPEIEIGLKPWFDRVEAGRGISNDLVVFALSRSFHFGVISGSALIHADVNAGRIIERRLPTEPGRKHRLYRLRRTG